MTYPPTVVVVTIRPEVTLGIHQLADDIDVVFCEPMRVPYSMSHWSVEKDATSRGAHRIDLTSLLGLPIQNLCFVVLPQLLRDVQLRSICWRGHDIALTQCPEITCMSMKFVCYLLTELLHK